MDDYSFSDSDWDTLDQGAAVQGDDINFDPNAESSAWTGEGMGWDQFNNIPQQDNSYDFNMNLSNIPEMGWQTGGTDWSAIDNQLGTGYNSLGTLAYDAMQNTPNFLQGKSGGGTQSFLSSLFGSQGGKGLASVLGALIEGSQNKKTSQQNPQIIQQMRQQQSPFDTASTGASQLGASSMRDAMQQQLASTMQNPYGQPIVRDQVDAMAKAQAIKDAAAGRRSNSATSSPALLAEQAKVAQNYINSLYNPAGAGMSVGMGGLDQLLAASKAGVQGYASPLMSALGYNQGAATNTNQMDALRAILQGGR